VERKLDNITRFVSWIIPEWVKDAITATVDFDLRHWWMMRNLDELSIAAEKAVEEIELAWFMGDLPWNEDKLDDWWE